MTTSHWLVNLLFQTVEVPDEYSAWYRSIFWLEFFIQGRRAFVRWISNYLFITGSVEPNYAKSETCVYFPLVLYFTWAEGCFKIRSLRGWICISVGYSKQSNAKFLRIVLILSKVRRFWTNHFNLELDSNFRIRVANCGSQWFLQTFSHRF